MLNLSDLTLKFIEYNFSPEQQAPMLEAFTLIDDFGIKFYEEKFLDIITRYDGMTVMEMVDGFRFNLLRLCDALLKEHGITLDTDYDFSLSDVVEVICLIKLINTAEIYQEISYITHADISPREVICHLLSKYTDLDMIKSFSIIKDVDSGLITSIQNLCLEKMSDETDATFAVKHKEYVERFFKFIEETPCIGLNAYRKGFTDVELGEFIRLYDIDIETYVDSGFDKIKTSRDNEPLRAQIALDVLSILIITKDDYTLPTMKLKKNLSYFTSDMLHGTALINLINRILSDFIAWDQAYINEQT